MERIAGSFRDPSGFVYERGGVLYRQVNRGYQDSFDSLCSSGLLERLWEKGLLVRHEEVDRSLAATPEVYRVLRPTRIPFVSYPYEWCFGAYRDAALATLEIQSEALRHGMTLKDASAYNIQFLDGRPVWIDTLSFDVYEPGQPWEAYRQFCQHFVAPLALMSRKDVRLHVLMQSYIDGIPLDMASRLLGFASKWSPRLLLHIHAHAKSQSRYAGKSQDAPKGHVSELALKGIVDSLRGSVEGLLWHPSETEWGNYHECTNYSDEAFADKRKKLEHFVNRAQPKSVWDLGANDGVFSRVAASRGIATVAFDRDPAAVEKNYRQVRDNEEKHLLPLLQDLTNPSPGIGWAQTERDALVSRGPVDMVMALALVHHLVISNNVPLDHVAAFLASLGHHLIIEFVPKEDSQVQKLLASREDIFPDYHQTGFEVAFSRYYAIREAVAIEGSCRTLYWMECLTGHRGES